MSAKALTRKLVATAGFLIAVCWLWPDTGSATPLIQSTLGTSGPGNFAILGLGGVNVTDTDLTLNGPGQTLGNVGVASTGNIALNSSTPPAIIGNLFLGNTATTSGSAGGCNPPGAGCNQISGTTFFNQDVFLNGAVADALAANALFNSNAGMFTVDQTISGNITSSQTLQCAAGDTVCVILVTGNVQLGNNDILTLNGTTAGESFILEVAGNITLNGGNNFSGGQIRLGGTLDSSDDAVIKAQKVSTGDNVTASGGSSNPCSAASQGNLGTTLGAVLCPGGIDTGNTLPNAFIQGILLDTQGGVGFSPGMVIGEIIGGGNEIRLVSGSQVINNVQATTGVPAPATVLLLGGGLVGIGFLRNVLRRR